MSAPVKIADLTKPQWDAALHAARWLMKADPDNGADRDAYRAAITVLCALLPEDIDAREVIKGVARWHMLNDLAASVAGLPAERFEA